MQQEGRRVVLVKELGQGAPHPASGATQALFGGALALVGRPGRDGREGGGPGGTPTAAGVLLLMIGVR